LAKTEIEFHWPGYQYMVPGTKLAKRLKRGDPGINRLDKIAKQHDIDYSHAQNLQDKWKADTKMIKAIDRLPGKKTMTERIVKRIMRMIEDDFFPRKEPWEKYLGGRGAPPPFFLWIVKDDG